MLPKRRKDCRERRSAGQEYLGLNSAQPLKYALLMIEVQLGCEIVETNDGPFAALVVKQVSLAQQANQRGELLLATRKVFALRGRRE